MQGSQKASNWRNHCLLPVLKPHWGTENIEQISAMNREDYQQVDLVSVKWPGQFKSMSLKEYLPKSRMF